MPKSICIATLVTMIAIAPAYSAAPKECTDTHMKQMDAMRTCAVGVTLHPA